GPGWISAPPSRRCRGARRRRPGGRNPCLRGRRAPPRPTWPRRRRIPPCGGEPRADGRTGADCPRTGCVSRPSLLVVADPVHLHALLCEPGRRPGHLVLRPVHLEDDPPESLLHVGPPDVRDEVEFLPQ